MNVGKGKRRLMSEINVVPYIDVMLVLLIIFMITAPLLTQGITVDLPNAPAQALDPELLKDNEPLVLSVDSEGEGKGATFTVWLPPAAADDATTGEA